MVSDAGKFRWYGGQTYILQLACPEAGGRFDDCVRLNTTKTNAVLWLQGAGRVTIQTQGSCASPPTLSAPAEFIRQGLADGYNPEGAPPFASAFFEESNARYAADFGGDAAGAGPAPGLGLKAGLQPRDRTTWGLCLARGSRARARTRSLQTAGAAAASAAPAFDDAGFGFDDGNGTTNTTQTPDVARLLVAEGWRVRLTVRHGARRGAGRGCGKGGRAAPARPNPIPRSPSLTPAPTPAPLPHPPPPHPPPPPPTPHPPPQIRGIAFDGLGRRPCAKLDSTWVSYLYNVAFKNCVAPTCPYKRPCAAGD
jgi:hypothetical protein